MNDAAERRPILLRQPQVRHETGYSRSTIYQRIKQGLLPPPVRLGSKTVAWPADEIAAINSARIAGVPDPGLQELVVKLVAARGASRMFGSKPLSARS